MSGVQKTVLVEFIDAATGEAFATADMPADRMPESFAVATTLQLADEPWIVERAVPQTRAEFVAAGRLTLTLRRVMAMSPENILYSLPTIGDGLPGAGDRPGSGLELHEDEWRQVELVPYDRVAMVEEEFAAINAVYDEHGDRDGDGEITGFRQIHLRSAATVLDPVPLSRIRELLAGPVREYDGVRFLDSPGLAEGTFAFGAGALTLYGVGDDDGVTVLGLHLAPNAGPGPVPTDWLEPLLAELDVFLVDWCRCAAAGPEDLAGYFTEVGAG